MPNPSDWLEIGDRVFTRRYELLDQQIGVVLGDDEALVVDTRSTRRDARELLDDIGRLTTLPVRVVVDSHWHWDHVFGNHDFRPANIWGHERCRSRLLADGELQRAVLIARFPDRADEFRAVVVDPPERTFAEAATVEVGGRPVELRYLGRGHTDADIVVLVPDTGVIFAGDLLEEGATPFFGDGYPMDWPDTVARMLPLVAGPVVPGHGAVGDRAFVERQLEAFRAVASLAGRVHVGELDRGAALALMPFSPETAVQPLDRALAQLRGDLD